MGFIFWIGFAVLVGVFASRKGRSGVGWFFLALIISPLICAIIIACLKDIQMEADVKQMEMEHQQMRERVASDERLYEHRLGKVENEIGRIQDNMANVNHAIGQNRANAALEAGEKQCPYCKEWIRADAILCKHCRSEIAPGNPAT